MNTDAILVKNFNVRMKDRLIIKNVDLKIKSQTLTALIGVNGSGKTTLMRALGGLLPSTHDAFFILDKRRSQYERVDFSRTVAWIPSEFTIPFNYRCEDLLMFSRFATHQGFPKKRDQSIVVECMQELEILEFKDRGVQELSSGERRRVLLGCAFVSDAAILLLDEPLANLDVKMAKMISRKIKEAVSAGRTIVMSTHHLDLMAKYCDDYVALENGAVASAGSVVDFFAEQVDAKLFE